MKRKDLEQLKEQSVDSLKKFISEAQNKALSIKSEMYAGREKNVKMAWAERRKIAIAKTLIKEKEMKGVVVK